MKLEEIFTFENLYDAYKQCRKSKQHKGEVIRFETNLSFNINSLVNEFATRKYKLGKYKEFLIYIYDNAACRENKGTLFAIKRLEKFLKNEYLKEHNNDIYFLKCDIQKYFPSIDHEILLDLLNKIDFSQD